MTPTYGPFHSLRAEAKKSSAKFYFTGQPCNRGHLSVRWTSNGQCIECKRLWNEEHQAERSEYHKEWVVRTGEDSTARAAEWRRLNPVQAKARAAEYRKNYRLENLEKIAATSLAYHHRMMEHEEYRARKSLHSSNMRARRKGADGFYTADDVEAINERQGFCCAVCGTDTASLFHVDHVVPVSRGGSNWPSNIQILCPHCNLSKGAKTMDEFLAWRMLRAAANDNRKTAIAA